MAFCEQCGNKLRRGAKFCPSCGNKVDSRNDAGETVQLFEGEIHKCPNCGEQIKAFTVLCPTCGYEFRDSKPSSAVREFARQLDTIEASRKGTGALARFANVFGVGTTNKSDVQKEELIRNFTVPNNKEDIYEFMILAASNIDASAFNIYGNRNMPQGQKKALLSLSKAWVAKFEQTYNKAVLSFGSDPDFTQIEKIYAEKTKEIKRAKIKGTMTFVGPFALMIAILMMIVIPVSLKSNSMEKQLNATVQEIQIDIQNGDYDEALIKANTLYYDRGMSNDKADDWDAQREAIIELIMEKQSDGN